MRGQNKGVGAPEFSQPLGVDKATIPSYNGFIAGAEALNQSVKQTRWSTARLTQPVGNRSRRRELAREG